MLKLKGRKSVGCSRLYAGLWKELKHPQGSQVNKLGLYFQEQRINWGSSQKTAPSAH